MAHIESIAADMPLRVAVQGVVNLIESFLRAEAPGHFTAQQTQDFVESGVKKARSVFFSSWHKYRPDFLTEIPIAQKGVTVKPFQLDRLERGLRMIACAWIWRWLYKIGRSKVYDFKKDRFRPLLCRSVVMDHIGISKSSAKPTSARLRWSLGWVQKPNSSKWLVRETDFSMAKKMGVYFGHDTS